MVALLKITFQQTTALLPEISLRHQKVAPDRTTRPIAPVVAQA